MKDKRKPTLSDRIGSAIRNAAMRGSGAQDAIDGLQGNSPSFAPQSAPPAPSLSPKRRPENKTGGIFDERKYEENKKKKK